MKRLIAIVLLALAVGASPAGAVSVGLGAYGGMSMPIEQDDNGSGPIFGLRVPVTLSPLFTVEPYFGSAANGDATQSIGGVDYTRSGFDVTSFGANLLLTFGQHTQFYPMVGIGSNKLTRTGSSDETMTSFNFGLGMGFTVAPKIAIHVRGEGSTLSNGNAGRTFGTITGGVTYSLHDFSAK